MMNDKVNPVGWFEIPVSDIARAKKFYEHVFEIELELHDMGPLRMAWFPMKQGTPGANGSLVQADSYVPSHSGTLVYFSVKEIDEALSRAAEKGGKILNPRTSIGEHGFVAHFEDSEGNRVAVHAVE